MKSSQIDWPASCSRWRRFSGMVSVGKTSRALTGSTRNINGAPPKGGSRAEAVGNRGSRDAQWQVGSYRSLPPWQARDENGSEREVNVALDSGAFGTSRPWLHASCTAPRDGRGVGALL